MSLSELSVTRSSEIIVTLWVPIKADSPLLSAADFTERNHRLRQMYGVPSDADTDKSDIIAVQVVNALTFKNHLKDPNKGILDPGNDLLPQGQVRIHEFRKISKDNYDACLAMSQRARDASAAITEGPTNIEVAAISRLVEADGSTPSLPAVGLPNVHVNENSSDSAVLVDGKTHEAFAISSFTRLKQDFESFLKHAFLEGLPVLSAQAAVDKEDLAFLRSEGTPCAPLKDSTPH